MRQNKKLIALFGSDFESQFNDKNAIPDFLKQIAAKCFYIIFMPGRRIQLNAFYGGEENARTICRTVNVPTKCKTLSDIAEWINANDFC